MDPITIRYDFRPCRRSLACGEVADLFGLADDEPPHVVADGVTLDVRPGDVVLFTGSSGSGKSSLLREAGRRLGAIDVAALDLPDVPLVDALTGPLPERLERLTACGLGEARLLLRTPTELSDGQRARFRIALGIERASPPVATGGAAPPIAIGGLAPGFLLCDEFAAVLDRTLAKVLAFNVRKLATRTGVGFLLATTHDDLSDDLNPDLLVTCRGDGDVTAERRDRQKKTSAGRTTFGYRTAPSPIGRTSLGGITARTPSGSSAASCCFGTEPSQSASASSAPRPRA
ncbi:MAG: hypothetical protein U0746_17130 [Gemmataceae bacterium]